MYLGHILRYWELELQCDTHSAQWAYLERGVGTVVRCAIRKIIRTQVHTHF